jgi:hypothetical protein
MSSVTRARVPSYIRRRRPRRRSRRPGSPLARATANGPSQRSQRPIWSHSHRMSVRCASGLTGSSGPNRRRGGLLGMTAVAYPAALRGIRISQPTARAPLVALFTSTGKPPPSTCALGVRRDRGDASVARGNGEFTPESCGRGPRLACSSWVRSCPTRCWICSVLIVSTKFSRRIRARSLQGCRGRTPCGARRRNTGWSGRFGREGRERAVRRGIEVEPHDAHGADVCPQHASCRVAADLHVR